MTGPKILMPLAERFRAIAAMAVCLSVCLSGPVLAQGSGKPAELPPSGYAGQQYVDSEGCVFLRAGTESETVWVPRVSAGGTQLCGYPPSGNRVPVEGEPGAAAIAPAADGAEDAEPSTTPAEAVGDYFVALGSFGFASNVAKAAAAADALGYPAITGQMTGGEPGLITVYAGPFSRKSKAQRALDQLRKAGYPDAVLMRF